MSLLHTIGHSTRAFPEFHNLLRAFEVNTLVDVRRFPGSRRYPQFNRENLSLALQQECIAYLHAPELGGRRVALADSPNTFWRNASFRAYADYMATPEFRDALERLLQLAGDGTVAVMCAEAVPWRCHRQLIADALVAHGHEVRHILSETRAEPHTLNNGAFVFADGSVQYPGKAGAQGSFFDG